jgi:hypothetical protein
MTCIYTGAYLHIRNYGAFVPADIHRAGDALVIRINAEEHWEYKTPFREPTHILTIPDRESEFYWSPGPGIITAVVPLDACPRTSAARPVLES